MKKLILMIIVILSQSCGPSRAELNQMQVAPTQTVIVDGMSEVKVQVYKHNNTEYLIFLYNGHIAVEQHGSYTK